MTGTNPRHPTAAELAGHDGFSLISNQKLLQLYTGLVQCRLLEKRLRSLTPRSRLAGRRACVPGQEAVMVAAAVDLLPEDGIAPSGCDLLLNFIQGKPLGDLLTRMAVRGPQSDYAASLHIALGVAMAHKTSRNGKIVLVFRGDEADSSGLWEQTLHAGGVHRLPILFVSPSDPAVELAGAKNQTGAVQHPRPSDACAFPRIPVDGNDVVAVYRVATEAIAHARKGSGPTLIECASEPSNSVSGQSAASGKSDDPIRQMEAYLARKSLFSLELKRETKANFALELDAGFKALEKSRSLHSKSIRGIALRRR